VQTIGREKRRYCGQACRYILLSFAPRLDNSFRRKPAAMRAEALPGSRLDRYSDAGPEALCEKRYAAFERHGLAQLRRDPRRDREIACANVKHCGIGAAVERCDCWRLQLKGHLKAIKRCSQPSDQHHSVVRAAMEVEAQQAQLVGEFVKGLSEGEIVTRLNIE